MRAVSSFTGDLHRLADWLAACDVDTVAMESTGVYWIPLFELLESRGFTLYLVNARHVKKVSGRKSDVLDGQWLQQLMTLTKFRDGRIHASHEEIAQSLQGHWREEHLFALTQALKLFDT